MYRPQPVEDARALLTEWVELAELAPPEPLEITPWAAMSLLQKAVRRGKQQLALQAAATLFATSPERLWRRCGGIVYEDIGRADLKTVALVTASLAGKRLRASVGGEWKVANAIVRAMTAAPKCRSADDLLMIIELHPGLAASRTTFSELSDRRLISIALNSKSLPERGLALLYILGTNQRYRSPSLLKRRGCPDLVFDVLRQLEAPSEFLEIAKEGYRITREALCVLMSFLLTDKLRSTSFDDDRFPVEACAGDAPGWAYDVYTREGQAALRRLLATNSETARWVREHVRAELRLKFLGGLLFRVEGGMLARRVCDPIGDELRCCYTLECLGVTDAKAAQALTLLWDDIPILNHLRLEVLRGQRT